jgi:hypothetical protein
MKRVRGRDENRPREEIKCTDSLRVKSPGHCHSPQCIQSVCSAKCHTIYLFCNSMSSLTSRDDTRWQFWPETTLFSFKKWNPLFVFKFTLLFTRLQIILFFIFYPRNPQIKIFLLVVRRDFLRNWIWKREKHASANLQVVTRTVFRK